MVTIRDVAREAGVSIATVSRILNNKGSHSDAVVKKVLNAAEKLNYAINVNGKRLKTGIKNTIGIILPEYFLYTYPNMLATLINEIYARSFYPELNLNLDLDQCFHLLRSGRYDGVIVVEPENQERIIHNIIKEEYHTVFLGGDISREDINFVEIDYFQAGYLAAKRLIKANHSNIMFLTDNRPLNIFAEIKRGYLFAHDEYGIQYYEEFIIDRSQLEESSEDLKEKIDRTTAIFSIDHKLSQLLIKILLKLNKKIPEDLSFITCGDDFNTETIFPELTTVIIPVEQAVSLAAEILTREILTGDRIIKRVKLMAQIKEKGSVLKRLTKK